MSAGLAHGARRAAPVRLGVVCSSGGSVFLAARQILGAARQRVEFAVVTDRECAAEASCAASALPWRRIIDSDRAQFSREAWRWLVQEQEVELVVLLSLRIVGPELYSVIPCFNIHPSLLPAFPGFHALERARSAGVRFFGSTLHLATASVDSGPIVAQCIAPMPPDGDPYKLRRISFAQKTYLLLLLVELWQSGQIKAAPQIESVEVVKGVEGAPATAAVLNANPGIAQAAIREAFAAFLRAEGIPWRP